VEIHLSRQSDPTVINQSQSSELVGRKLYKQREIIVKKKEIQTATIEEHTIVAEKREREKRSIGVLFKEKVIGFCIHQSRSSLCVSLL
jgi:hypothetical protein